MEKEPRFERVEEHARIGSREVLAHLLLEDDGQGNLVALLADQGAAAAAREVGGLVVGDQEVGHRRFGIERVERLELALHVDQQLADAAVARRVRRGQWICPSPDGDRR